MKSFAFLKNVPFFCTAAMFVCTGCSQNSASSDFSPQLAPAYTIKTVMTYGERSSEAKCSLTRRSAGCWDATFTEPSTLSGVTLTFENNAVSANYKGLSFTVPKSAMPAKTMLLLATDVLDSLDSLDSLPCTHNDDGTWKIDGETECGTYQITFSDEGELCSFEIPNEPLKMQFSGYSVTLESPAGTNETTTTTDTVTTETTSTSTT